MNSEKQYIDLYKQARQMIFDHSSEAMNAVRDEAFEHFKALGFPSKKVERYKYTDIQKLFAPDYGVNLNRLQIPVDPYEAFRCDVPNLSTSLYFVVNDAFYSRALPKSLLPEGVVIGSMKELFNDQCSMFNVQWAEYYSKLASIVLSAVTASSDVFAIFE